MFGEKAAEIARLNQRVAELEGIERLPYLGLAQQLQAEIDRRIVAGNYSAEGAVQATVDAMHEEQREKILADKIKAMSADEFFEFYRHATGEEVAADALRRIAAVRARKLERKARLDEMREQAKISKRLDLTLLPQGQIVQLGLFHHNLPMEFRQERSLACRTITGRVDTASSPNTLTVLNDTILTTLHTDRFAGIPKDYYNQWSFPCVNNPAQMEDFTQFTFGNLIADTFKSEVTLGAAIAVGVNGEQPATMHSVDFGYLATRDGTQLLGSLNKDSLDEIKYAHR